MVNPVDWDLVRWVKITLAVVLIGFAAGGYSILELVEKNKKAILVSCTLLSNVATESGAIPGEGASKAALKQREITALAFDVLIRGMTAEELEKFNRLNAEMKKLGGFITLPKCSQVANHPESVKQLGEQMEQKK